MQIHDEAVLLRRIPPEHVKGDGQGGLRITSQAFDPPYGGDGFSVYVEELLEAHGLHAEAVLDGHEGFGFVALPASVIRAENLMITLSPDEDDGPRGQAHADVTGSLPTAVRRRLARAARVHRWPGTRAP